VPSPRASPTINRPTPTRLLESGVVFRLEDFALYRVSSAIDERRNAPRKFISSDKKQLLLPKSMSSVHLEFTDYYFPDGKDLPGKFRMRIIAVSVLQYLCCVVDVKFASFSIFCCGHSLFGVISSAVQK